MANETARLPAARRIAHLPGLGVATECSGSTGDRANADAGGSVPTVWLPAHSCPPAPCRSQSEHWLHLAAAEQGELAGAAQATTRAVASKRDPV